MMNQRILLLLLFLSIYQVCKTQTPENPIHAEKPEDGYVSVDPATRRYSPPMRINRPGFFSIQVNTNAAGQNILGDAANEPSIAIDPTNPDRMVMGWRQFDTISSNFRQAGFAYSVDGGSTWTNAGPLTPGVFRSDPVLGFDSKGNFYYNSLRVNSDFTRFYCEVFKSTGDGTWGNPVYAYGGDKQWMTVDRSGGIGDGHIYANWNYNFTDCLPGNDFTYSKNANGSYDDCTRLPDWTRWGTMDVNLAGTLYSVGFNFNNGISVNRSENIQNAMQVPVWENPVVIDLQSSPAAFGIPNPQGLLGQVWVATGQQLNVDDDNVYIVSSINPSSQEDPCDLIFISSFDGGDTWGNLVNLSEDVDNAYQWMGTMSVAPNGRIDVVWLDTRSDPSGFRSALYYTNSVDFGETWLPDVQLSETFNSRIGWPNQNKMGDYFGMISDNEGAHLAWTATFNGEQDVYYGRILTDEIVAVNEVQRNDFVSTVDYYPNPFTESLKFDCSLIRSAHLSINIYDINGRLIKKIIDEKRGSGTHRIIWGGTSPVESTTTNGLYFFEIKANGVVIKSGRVVLSR